jgi:hypothetical protein
MAGASAGGKPLRRFFRARFHAAAATDPAFAVIAGKNFFFVYVVFPVAGVVGHGFVRLALVTIPRQSA